MSTKIAKNQRSRRQLEAKQPKLIENTKALIGIKGPKTSEVVATVLKDLHKFKQPESKLLTKRNITRPFEDISSVEFLGKVNDSSLFSYGSHSKKRPHNLVIGRLFDFQLLDMFELGVNGETFQSMDAFDGLRKAVVRVGSKPAILFQGDLWDSNSDLVMLRNLFLDFFRGETLSKINLSALDRVIILTVTSAAPNTLPVIHFRHYGVALKKSSSSLPRVELEEVGPRMDLTLRRRKSGSEQLVKESLRQPRQTTKTIFQKNIERNAMGDRMGRVHMQKQDLSNLYVAKLKGLKKRKRSDDADHNGADGGAAEPDENGMTDVDTPASSSRSSSTSRRPSSAPSSSAPRRMSTSHDSMDEFASRATTNQAGRPRTSTVDKNLQKKKAGGFGSKPIEGGYRNVAKKKKLDK